MINPENIIGVFNTDTHPDVRSPSKLMAAPNQLLSLFILLRTHLRQTLAAEVLLHRTDFPLHHSNRNGYPQGGPQVFELVGNVLRSKIRSEPLEKLDSSGQVTLDHFVMVRIHARQLVTDEALTNVPEFLKTAEKAS
jgi:hypothetical protein